MATSNPSDTATWLAGWLLCFVIVFGSLAAVVILVERRASPTVRRVVLFGWCAVVVGWRAYELSQHRTLRTTDALLIIALLLALSGARRAPETRMPLLANRWRRRVDEAYARERAERHAGHGDTGSSDVTRATF